MPYQEESEYLRNWKRYRAAFTPEQWARYHELIAGRWNFITGRDHTEPRMLVRIKSEAVDVVMREPVPGVCCQRCLEKHDALL